MLKTTIGGIEVWIGKLWDVYVVIRGREVLLMKEKPPTDQELEEARERLINIQNQFFLECQNLF